MSGTQSSSLQVLKQTFSTDGMKGEIAKALPKHVSRDKFIRNTITLLSQNEELVKCERNSLFAAVLTGASLGLMPDAFLGEFYIVPYKGKATPQVGYKGLLILARRSGEIANISHGVVYEKDTYEYVQGDDSMLTIHPYMGNDDPGPPVFAWCVLTLNDGSKMREVMKAYEIEKIRQASPSGNSPAWKNSWGEMARKTVIKRILKTAPRSTELAEALALDDANEGGAIVHITPQGLQQDEPLPPPAKEKAKPARKSRTQQLAEEIEKAEPEGENEPPPPEPDGGATIDNESGVVV